MKLSDFENLPWRTYQDENPHKCVFCNEKANNVGFNLCNSHIDIYRKMKQEKEEKWFKKRINELSLDLSQVKDISFDGIDHSDSPDYCDAFISEAYQNDTQLTDEQLDFINDHCRDFVYEALQKYLY